MDNLIERNKSYKNIKHSQDLLKLYKSSERHNKNMFEEQKKLEEKALKNREKIFKKYTTFYFFRKNKERELRLKNSKSQNKLIEKAEKIEEIEKKEKLKTKELIRKLSIMQKRKEEILKHKNDDLIIFNKKRKNYINTCKIKKENIEKEFSDMRLDILDYQASLIERNMEKEKVNNFKKTLSTERTLNDQINFKKNMRPFLRKLETIKSENIMRKSVDNRKKMFWQKKKEEAERKKREEEESLI